MSKSGRKVDLILENRIRLNAGKFSVHELVWLFGVSYSSIQSKAHRMGVSLRVKKERNLA